MQRDVQPSQRGLGGIVAHGAAARLSAIGSGLTFAIASLVLSLHLWGRPDSLFQAPGMKPNTALCFLLLSLSQRWLMRHKAAPGPQLPALLLGMLAGAIAGATLSEYAFDLELGIDSRLVELQQPRMSPISAICLLAFSGVTCLSAVRSSKSLLCQTFLVVTTLCSLLPILGYLYRAPFLFGAAIAVAPATAAAGVSLTLAFVALRSEEGLWPLLVGDTAGSTLLRRGLPVAFLLPIVFGWLRLEAEQLGALGLELGVALISTATSFSFAALLVWSARWLRTQDLLRRAAGEKLREAHQTLETRVEERTRELKASERELRRAALELTQAKDAAERAMRARADFLARMSHEMRTPLNGVVGMLEIVMHGELSAAQRGYAQTARSSADALLALISDILDFSQIDTGKLLLESGTFRLRDCLAQALAVSAPAAHQKGLTLSLQVDEALPECVVGDRQRLRQVITNLVSNGVKFSERGQVALQVRAGTRAQGHAQLSFSVVDTGVGIARDKQAQIFHAFTQGDESTRRRFGGAGLGLAISAQLVQLMGGVLSVESAPGEGARFSFSLALGVDEAAELELSSARRAFAGQRALAIAAEPARAASLVELLHRWQIEATTIDAQAVQRALREAQLAGRAFAFMLLDDRALAGRDERYLETLRELVGPRFPIILITLATPVESERERYQKHVSAQLTEPIVASDLFETITSLLNAPEGQRAARRVRAEQRALRVLLAEDNEVNRRVASFFLRDAGYQVVAVEDGKKAVNMLAQQRFDVVLMDGHMPELDGIEATREIRSLEAGSGRRTPIIALTAQAMKGDRERYLAAGMDGYLTKPFQSAQLFAAIDEVLVNAGATPPRVAQSSPAPRASLPASSQSALYERSDLLARLTGVEHVLRPMIQVFAEEAPELLQNLRAALDQGEPSTVERAAHKLVGALLTVSAKRAGESARELENAARAGDLSQGEALFRRIAAELAATREAFVAAGDLTPSGALPAGELPLASAAADEPGQPQN